METQDCYECGEPAGAELCDECHGRGPMIEPEDLTLDHIPDSDECAELLERFAADRFWPNVWHVNERGNVDLLAVGLEGAQIVTSWV